MPSKTFLPGCKVMFHPLYDGGTTDNYCVKKEYIDNLEKNQAEFIKGLQILLENGIQTKWIFTSDDNLKLLNQIRMSVGLSEVKK